MAGEIIILIFGKIIKILKILTGYRREIFFGGPANHLESFSFPSAKQGPPNADIYSPLPL